MASINSPAPSKKIKSLGVLIGQWEFSSPSWPGGNGKMHNEWLENDAYLIQRHSAPDPAPNSSWIIAPDDAEENFTALYTDSRGVARVYKMSLKNNTWKIWRLVPGFYQRFTGKISPDGQSIFAKWESSEDGSKWTKDFDLNYHKEK